jgi:hypothetical protein
MRALHNGLKGSDERVYFYESDSHASLTDFILSKYLLEETVCRSDTWLLHVWYLDAWRLVSDTGTVDVNIATDKVLEAFG